MKKEMQKQPKKKNRKRFPVLAFFLFAAIMTYTVGSAQITIDQSDMPSPGDTIRKSNAINFGQYDFELTGENYNWDFSDLEPITQSVDSFLNVTDTPVFYWPFFLLSANLASPIGDSPYEQLPLTDIFNFYKNSSNDFRDVGFAATAYGIPLPFKYDSPDILYDFPMNYGNTDVSQSGLEFVIPDFGYLLIDRNRNNTVDGWGTLTTPFGTFETLRLKSEVQEYDSLYLDSLGVGIPINLVYTEYKWLAKGKKIPLLKVTQNILGATVEYVDSIRDLSLGISEDQLLNLNKMTVYPNPASDFIYIDLPDYEKDIVDLYIYNIAGEKLTAIKNRQINGILKINLNDLTLKPGIYIIRCRTTERQYAKTFIYSP